MPEKMDVVVIEREPGPPFQGWERMHGTDKRRLTNEEIEAMFEAKFGYLPEFIIWDPCIVKAGPILDGAQEGG